MSNSEGVTERERQTGIIITGIIITGSITRERERPLLLFPVVLLLVILPESEIEREIEREPERVRERREREK